jgi:hypothetical protein
MDSNIEMYQKDLEELITIISNTQRPNLKRQFEEYRKLLQSQVETEKKKLEVKEKDTSIQNQPRFESVSKYAFDGSGETFVKYFIIKKECILQMASQD